MRKILLLLLVGLLFVIPSGMAIEQNLTNINGTPRYERDYPSLRIEQLKYEPYPVTPGEYFDLWIKVKNRGDNDAKDVIVKIVDEYPFSAYVESEKTYDKINGLGEVLIKYKIRVDENAIEGLNKLKIRTKIGWGSWIEHSVNIDIRSLDLLLDITNISVDKLEPGQVNTMSMTLENNGVSLVRDVNIELDIDSSAIPIVPVYSSSKKKIYQLPGGTSQELTFDLMAETSATANVYKVPIFVTYYDEAGIRYVKNETIGLLVGSDAALEINVEDADVFTKKSKGKVTLALSNIGPSKIKFLTIELLEDDKYNILSAVKRTYLGNIDSDDFETVSYDIYTKAGRKDENVMLKVLIEYKDAFNQEMSEVVEVPLRVFSSSEASKYGLKPSSNGLSKLLYLVIIIIIYQIVVGWRKTKNINKTVKTVFRNDIHWVVDAIGKLRWRYIKRVPRKIRIFLKTR